MPNDGDAQVLQVLRREARKELFRIAFSRKAASPNELCRCDQSILRLTLSESMVRGLAPVLCSPYRTGEARLANPDPS